MKIRTLEEIERDERLHGPVIPSPAPVVRMEDLRPGPVKTFLLGLGELFLLLPRALWRLLDYSLAIAVILGLAGCIIFGLVYLFG
ncbi:MAG TPA: hypothetical protein VL283_05745 [Candidatus Baltobacteraceae bacterium]|nr:hypothetical protein [Candidatus Baltobacteraceae bacterium]